MTGQQQFQVDLRGIVEILSHHLYSGPRVYIRELLQNACDAIEARRGLDGPTESPTPAEAGPPTSPSSLSHTREGADRRATNDIEIDTSQTGRVVVRDRGIGLTADEMRSMLATIGSSSKRDLAMNRTQFLGQFGIGLLSCFLVADNIVVRSRSAKTPDAPTMQWVGRSDGTYTIEPAEGALAAPGSEVVIEARPDAREWVTAQRVRRLVDEFACYLPYRITLIDTPDHSRGKEVADRRAPWDLHGEPLINYCLDTFGFQPLDVIPIDIPAAGVRGVGFVLDAEARHGSRAGDVVYLRRMLLSRRNTQLVPEWAFFMRMVLDAGDLPPTASREELRGGPLLEQVVDSVGSQIRQHIETMERRDPARFSQFCSIHGTALIAMAGSDREMLDFVRAHITLPTALGDYTLDEIASRGSAVQYVTTRTEFATLREIAAAQDIPLVNASYSHMPRLLDRLAAVDRGLDVRMVSLRDIAHALPSPRPDQADAVARLRSVAHRAIDVRDVEVSVRSFAPADIPALYLPADAAHADADQDDDWSGLLDDLGDDGGGPEIVLNLASAPVQELTIARDEVAIPGMCALYSLARLASSRSLDEYEQEQLADALSSLISQATRSAG